jgi:hypothetical protein
MSEVDVHNSIDGPWLIIGAFNLTKNIDAAAPPVHDIYVQKSSTISSGEANDALWLIHGFLTCGAYLQ